MNTQTKTHRKIQCLFVFVGLLVPLTAGFPDPLPGEIYLAQGEEDIRIRGAEAVGKLGSAACAFGDLNGDGYKDLVTSAPRAHGPVGTGAGQTYIFFGTPTFPDTIDLTQTDADVTIYGMVVNEWSGSALASGDLNGDGFDDLVIGALYSYSGSGSHAGRVYVLFGGEVFPPQWDLSTDSADVIIAGGGSGYRLGEAVACGEINGDGIADLVVSAPYADTPNATDGGEVYVFWGNDNWDTEIELQSQPADLTVQAEATSNHLGVAIATGDVNGDANDDLLIGTPQANPAGRLLAGIVYLVYGESSMPDTINLSNVSADVQILGAESGDRLGTGVAIGDMNIDGHQDIIVGAPYAASVNGGDAGEIYVIAGASYLDPTFDLNSRPPEMLVSGAALNDYTGSALAVGDVNADGHGDLLIGVPNADVGGGIEAGISYVIYGRSPLPPWMDLGVGHADITIYGVLDNDLVGQAMAVGDINSDGFGEIIIGATGVDTPGGNSAGETYVIFGDGDNPVFSGTRDTPAGNLPNLRFPAQYAWVDFANGGSGLVTVSRTPTYPPYTTPVAPVWWEVNTTKIFVSIIQVTFRYTAQQISNLDENYLTLWRRNNEQEPFVLVPGTSVIPATNRITAPVNFLGQFTLSDITHPLGVPLEEKSTGIITDYRLFPAFPNPFNSSVTISYDIPTQGNVSLSVWNILGQQVAELIDQPQPPGHYRVSWDAGSNTSGLYFMVLEINGFEAVEKILLLK